MTDNRKNNLLAILFSLPWCCILPAIFSLISTNFAFAHEPVFSLGPETIYKGGIGIETEMEYEKTGSERSADLHEEIIYGLREDFSLTARFPFILEKKESDSTSSGFGDLALRGKFRFYKKDCLGAQDKAAFIGGVKFPTGDEDKNPSLGTGSFDYLIGLSAGHESLKWYYFGTVRYWANTKGDSREKGDKFLYDVAFGLRPVLKEYYDPDLVLLLELSGEHRNKDIIRGVNNSNSGGDILYLGPTFLWSYRNCMIKGGIQLPIYQDLNGVQEDEDFRSIIAVEIHF